MKRIIAVLCMATALSCACTNTVRNNPNGITVTARDGSKVRLEVVDSKIIRVTAVPKGARFHDGESLVVIPQEGRTSFTTSSGDGCAVLSTGDLTARVDINDGKVTFTDALTSETLAAEDRREFAPIEVEGSRGYTVRQVFQAADEAFYGLGQHQADEWNYKGRNEELYQYNTKISVPFVVSSKGYGVLWDSYSFCRWGDPRDYAHIGEVFTLYDKDGETGALTGTYTPASGEVLIRRESALAQEFLRTPECDIVRNSPEGFNFSGSHVSYEGCLEPSESGLFHFYLYYAGYTRVFIDGMEVMPEIWRTAWNPNGRKFECEMEAGRKYPVRIEWTPDGSVSYCGLRVLSPVDPREQAKMSWWGEMQQQIDYYFIAGGNADEVISGYRTLTGKAQVMPKWAVGYWQSRERYTSQEQLTGTLAEFRKRHIPVDNIVQDWQYWKDDAWGSHEFDEKRFPDPKGMVDSIHAMGGRFMISVWPKFYTGTEHFREMDERGWIYQTAIRDSVKDWLGYQQSFYDAYAAGARKLFWEQMRDHLFPLGIDAWWMDASEPNIHDCTDMDYRKKLCGPTALGTSAEYFNAYALMNAQAIYEGQRREVPDQRVFLLTRNGFAGLQRYSTASWSGDIGTRWEDMKAQISAGLNYSISGVPFWGQDIGGFSVENRYMAAQGAYDATGKENADLREWRELNARWHEWGVFCPLYRAHGQWPFREPWNIAPEGHPAYKAIVECDRLRYRLMPYIYTLTGRVHFEDYTIMRPLVMDFVSDSKVLDISDEYMFGDAFLICPVYEYGARSREVYLPEGGWYDWYDGFRYTAGGRSITADAPYWHCPIYVREGQIVPLGEDIEYTAQEQDGSLRVLVFTGKDASFSLYEDDGVSYGYERGEYSNIPFSWNEADQCLTIGRRQNGFPGMPEVRSIEIVHISPAGTRSVPVTYSGNEIQLEF